MNLEVVKRMLALEVGLEVEVEVEFQEQQRRSMSTRMKKIVVLGPT